MVLGASALAERSLGARGGNVMGKPMKTSWVSALLSAVALTGCVSIKVSETENALRAALAQASVRECPPERRQAGARTSGPSERSGVEEREIARVPLSAERGVLRLRRLDVAPGGVLPWHEHSTRQGMALILDGEMTEYRNDCLDPLRFRAGDAVRETAETAHFWRNESAAPAAILVSDVLAP